MTLISLNHQNINYICSLFRISLNKNKDLKMATTLFYTVFDYNNIDMDTAKRKTKCCKKYKKKGKFNCGNCPKL